MNITANSSVNFSTRAAQLLEGLSNQCDSMQRREQAKEAVDTLVSEFSIYPEANIGRLVLEMAKPAQENSVAENAYRAGQLDAAAAGLSAAGAGLAGLSLKILNQTPEKEQPAMRTAACDALRVDSESEIDGAQDEILLTSASQGDSMAATAGSLLAGLPGNSQGRENRLTKDLMSRVILTKNLGDPMAISTTNYSTLTEMMRRSELSPETVQQFRAKAIKAVDHAVDVFFKPEREVAEGRQAYDGLTDIESALRTYVGRLSNSVNATGVARQEAIGAAAAANPARSEEVINQDSVLRDGRHINKGKREYGAGQALTGDLRVSSSRELGEGITALAAKMGQTLPLYMSVAMVPGPLSVTLKDHLKQTLEFKANGSSYSESRAEQDSFRLLTLSAGKKTFRSSSSSSTSESGKVESTTVDEKVLTELHGIRSALESLGYVEPTTAKLAVKQEIKEYDTESHRKGFFGKTWEVTTYLANRGSRIDTIQVPDVPAEMKVGFAPSSKGLEPTAGSDILELVEKNQKLTPEFVDQLREKSQAAVSQAIDTLFKPGREVAEGREAYDKLTNVGRALKLVKSRWPYSSVEEQLMQLGKVAPLYACVAMTPGEMSSSVKNYAKVLATYNVASSYGGSSTSNSIQGSLLTLGLSEGSSQSSFGGSFNSSAKFETTTTDELITSTLHQLQVKLGQMHIATRNAYYQQDEESISMAD